MARVYTINSARQSKRVRRCVRCGRAVEVGETYKYADFKTGPYTSLTRTWCKDHLTPKPSELTTNDRLATLYSAQESVQAVLAGEWEAEDLATALEDAADTAEEVASEYEESATNLEEYFPGSAQVDEIREKVDACNNWAEALRNAAQEIRSKEPGETSPPDECAQCGQGPDENLHDSESDEFEHEFEEPEEDDSWREEASQEADNALGELEL